MKKILLSILILGWSIAQAQVLRPNEWDFELAGTEYNVGDTLELVFKATIEDKW